METNNNNEQFEPDWMSDSDEVAVRLMVDPTTFMRLYSSRFPNLAEVHQQMALDSNDTMIFIGVIKRILEKLPKKIRKAQEGVDSAKLRKLGEIQQTIQDILQAGTVNILRPTIPMHEVVYEYIDRHEKELSDYLLEVWKLKYQITDPAMKPADDKPDKRSRRPPALAFAEFTDKLKNGFTETDLNGLLVHMLVKDREGATLKFTKYILHSIIDALRDEEYFESGNRELDQKALSKYLGLEETRITNGSGGIGTSTQPKKDKAITYLKNKRKNNGSESVH